MIDRIARPRPFSLLLLAVSAAALGTAFVAQFAYGYEPCVLCVYQRIPYGVLLILGTFGLLSAGKAPMHAVALFAMLSFIVGAAIAGYHVGVEQTWWVSAAPCGGGLDMSASSTDFLAALQQKAEKSCGDIDWTLFGISMATYNFVVSAVMAIVCLIVWPKLLLSEKTL